MRPLASAITRVFAPALVLAGISIAPQAPNPSGTWRVDGVGPNLPWTLILKSDGSKLTGTVRTCASSSGVASPVDDGVIDGKAIRFACTSRDGNRTITFSGTLNGDAIEFTWHIEAKPGTSVAPRDAMFGASAPARFTARRVSNATEDVPQRGAGPGGRGRGPAAAAPELGELQTFKDWVIGCDNTWRCTAESLTPADDPGRHGASIVITRDAGPDAGVEVRFPDDAKASKEPLEFVIDGRKIASAPVEDGVAVVQGSEAMTLAAAMARAAKLEIRQGSRLVGRPSLTGTSAALRYMDAQQARDGTTTAIVATGTVGGHTVPAGPPMPFITRLVPDPSLKAEPLSYDERTSAGDVAGCPRDAPLAEVQDLVVLSPATTLVLIPCGVGNYNQSAGVLIARGAPGRRTFARARFDYEPGAVAAGSPPRVVNGVWDAMSAQLSSERKGRSLSDCGSSQTYVWDGAMFRLVGARLMDDCRGASEWIVVWRATPRP